MKRLVDHHRGLFASTGLECAWGTTPKVGLGVSYLDPAISSLSTIVRSGSLDSIEPAAGSLVCFTSKGNVVGSCCSHHTPQSPRCRTASPTAHVKVPDLQSFLASFPRLLEYSFSRRKVSHIPPPLLNTSLGGLADPSRQYVVELPFPSPRYRYHYRQWHPRTRERLGPWWLWGCLSRGRPSLSQPRRPFLCCQMPSSHANTERRTPTTSSHARDRPSPTCVSSSECRHAPSCH